MASSSETALVAPSTALATIPGARLHPVSRARELTLVLGTYFVAMAAATSIGSGATLAVLGGLFAFVIKRRRDWYRWMARQRELLAALEKDDIAAAERIGRSLVMGGMRLGLAHTLALTSWAVVEVRRGRPREGIEVYQRVLASGRLRGRAGRLLEVWRVMGGLALAHAIVGQLDDARSWLDRADEGAGPSLRGALLNVRLVVMCRHEGPAAALARYDAEFRDSEALLRVSGARQARMLEAFLLEQVATDDYRSDATERRERALDRARESRRGAFDYLAVEWPQLREFLRQHRLDEP